LDWIVIPGIPLEAHVGVTEEERASPQEIQVGLTLHLDLSRAGASDALADTVDYEAVCQTVSDVVGDVPFHLIEAIAERVASAILDAFAVARVDVSVKKPDALRERGVAFAAVEISRDRDG
jgi:dihydroneopterin aldolase